jgi:murein DD-endopeptidase MepM/ murein hydrolase activator NlpD
MSFSEKIKLFFERNREKHKLSFTNDITFHEKWSLKLSTINLITLIVFYTIIIIVLLVLLIHFSSVGRLFNEASQSASVEQINQNRDRIDTLNSKVKSRQMYLDDLQHILRDEPFDDSTMASNNDSGYTDYNADFNKSREDSLLRYKIENEGSKSSEYSYDFFLAPVKGRVSKSFNKEKSHFGVDVVTEKNAPIKSCLEGTVIFAGWSSNDGEVIILQHSGDFISVYKHCSSLLKKLGDNVQTTDPLAIVGNTGKHSSGPHLHFEIWKKGTPLNPQEFINFQK